MVIVSICFSTLQLKGGVEWGANDHFLKICEFFSFMRLRAIAPFKWIIEASIYQLHAGKQYYRITDLCRCSGCSNLTMEPNSLLMLVIQWGVVGARVLSEFPRFGVAWFNQWIGALRSLNGGKKNCHQSWWHLGSWAHNLFGESYGDSHVRHS